MRNNNLLKKLIIGIILLLIFYLLLILNKIRIGPIHIFVAIIVISFIFYLYKNILFILMLLFISVILYYIYWLKTNKTNQNKKEGFSIEARAFEEYQKINNPQVIYNMDDLEKNTTPEEFIFYLKNGYFEWEEDTKKQFIKNVQENTMIKVNPENTLYYYQKVYSNGAMKQLFLDREELQKIIQESTCWIPLEQEFLDVRRTYPLQKDGLFHVFQKAI